MPFAAGQYLEIVDPSGASIPLSIASSPLRLPELELHYRSAPGSEQARLLDALLEQGGPLELAGPFGEVCVRGAQDRPLLLVAGGTGAAQALAIIDDLTLRRSETRVTLLACADSEAEFYFADALGTAGRHWLDVELIADPRRNADNAALAWLTAQAQQHRTHRVILCGSPDFVYAAEDALTRGGLSAQSMESDVFAYAPRS